MARVFISHASRDAEQAARMLEWLRAQGFEGAFLDFDQYAGIPPGADWERTLYREIARAEAIILILTTNWFASKWCFAEYTQARALGKAIFPLIESPAGDTYVAPDIQNLDLRKDREGGLARLAAELTRIALDARDEFPWDETRPPFPGLLAYDEPDAAIYFGRDDDIRLLIERLNARRAQGGTKLVALLGASGSGKSSLMRAGVLPRLKKRDKRNWIVLPPFRPQLHPIDELAQAVAQALGPKGDWRQVREAFAAKNMEQTLHDLARDLRAAHAANDAQILISIDQGEELFSTADKADAERFWTLVNVMLSEHMPFIVLLALRSDYLGQLQQVPGLQVPFEDVQLKPLPLDRVRDIIEGPAHVAGLTVDNALVAAAIRDAATDDALPLLAFALRELYDRFAKSGGLAIAAYRALGDEKANLSPLENAVRQRAEQVLTEAKPTSEQLQALKDAFVPAMVRVNAEGEYARRSARLDTLPAHARALLERLANARLLILRQEGDVAIVEVAHEALLRKWPLLRGWLDDEREFLVGKRNSNRIYATGRRRKTLRSPRRCCPVSNSRARKSGSLPSRINSATQSGSSSRRALPVIKRR
jgi:TIR domain